MTITPAFESADLDPIRDRPLDRTTTTELRASCAAWLGVRPANVIVFPFASLPPLPHPPGPRPDGRGRLPAGISGEGARHPAWWLDADTIRRDPDESVLAYGVRLWIEIGACQPGHGIRPVDALAHGLGWSRHDPVVEERVVRYAAGGWDADLCRFALRRPSGTHPSRVQSKAASARYLQARLAGDPGGGLRPEKVTGCTLGELALPSPPP